MASGEGEEHVYAAEEPQLRLAQGRAHVAHVPDAEAVQRKADHAVGFGLPLTVVGGFRRLNPVKGHAPDRAGRVPERASSRLFTTAGSPGTRWALQ